MGWEKSRNSSKGAQLAPQKTLERPPPGSTVACRKKAYLRLVPTMFTGLILQTFHPKCLCTDRNVSGPSSLTRTSSVKSLANLKGPNKHTQGTAQRGGKRPRSGETPTQVPMQSSKLVDALRKETPLSKTHFSPITLCRHCLSHWPG